MTMVMAAEAMVAVAVTLLFDAVATPMVAQSAADGRPDGNNESGEVAMQ